MLVLGLRQGEVLGLPGRHVIEDGEADGQRHGFDQKHAPPDGEDDLGGGDQIDDNDQVAHAPAARQQARELESAG
jgi:hypothetical protein